MEHFKIVYVGCFYIQISINSSTIVLTSMFLGFQMRTFLLELNLNHCLLLLLVSCCMCSYYIFWKNMGFLKNYVANMGQIAKKLRKSSIYGAALKLCSLLVTLLKACFCSPCRSQEVNRNTKHRHDQFPKQKIHQQKIKICSELKKFF